MANAACASDDECCFGLKGFHFELIEGDQHGHELIDELIVTNNEQTSLSLIGRKKITLSHLRIEWHCE